MKEDQLKLLENRINSAIAFIENMRTREKNLLSEKEELRRRILLLEKGIEEKEKRNDDLLKTQKYLKEKLEFILGKLEGLADVPGVTDGGDDVEFSSAPAAAEAQPARAQPLVKEKPRGQRPAAGSPGAGGAAGARESGGIIIEENIVDLKEENEKNKPRNAARGPQGAGRQDETRPGSRTDGYSGDLFSVGEGSFEKECRGEKESGGWRAENPFVEV